jgi:hypothetical protein
VAIDAQSVGRYKAVTATATDEVKAALRKTLEDLSKRGTELLSRTEVRLGEVESQDEAWGAAFKTLHAASCRLPIRPFNRYYQRELKAAAEPLFVGLMDELNLDHFREMPPEYFERLAETYQTPAVRATENVFDDVANYFRETSARVLTLRFFSNSEPLLKKFENALSPPWAEAIVVRGGMTEFRLPPGMGLQPVHEHPPHLQIYAVRDANRGTLRILRDKLREIVATLRTAIDELPFADKLQTPKPVPQTLIDYSTHIGEGATIRDAAVGQGAKRER